MKALVFVAGLGLVGCVFNGRIRREHDEFTQQDLIVMDQMTVPISAQGLIDVAHLELTFSARPRGDSVRLWLTPYDTTDAAERDWRYLRCHAVHFLADGQPVRVGGAEHDGRVALRSGVHESVAVTLQASAALQMARATVVRGRVCTDVFQLKPAQLARLRDFVREAGLVAERDADVIVPVATSGGEAPPAPATPITGARVDDMTGERIHETTGIELRSEAGLLRLAFRARSGSVALSIEPEPSAARRYAGCHGVVANVDGRPLVVGAATYSEQSLGGGQFAEAVTVPIEPAALYMLGVGALSRVRVCSDTLTFRPEDRAALRGLWHAMQADAVIQQSATPQQH